MPSFNTTGIKIKLLNALINGRFVVANKATVEGTGLNPLCKVVETSEDFRNAITEVFILSFTEEDKKMREEILGKAFNNEENVQKLLKWIYE